MFEQIGDFIIKAENFIGGYPLLILLVGGGIYFMVYSKFTPLFYFKHSIQVLSGKYDTQTHTQGDISRFEALASSLAATVGMGNISGVAIAITTGGPGALFWMWVSAMVGMATQFFTCSLAVMYRGKDTLGQVQGGPMYVITEGLGKKWHFLAVFFCVAGLGGSLPLFQANQLTEILRGMIFIPAGWVDANNHFQPDLIVGITLALMTSFIIFGGIKRIAKMATALVPLMVILYVFCVLSIILMNFQQIPACVALIFHDAFTGQAVAGGAIGTVMIIGVRRAAFSNEAGIGTTPMMYGATKSQEPIREGIASMMNPFVDTIVVCSMTALAILITNTWVGAHKNESIIITAKAFSSLPYIGLPILIMCVLIFALTTLFSYSYYGMKCVSFLFGAKYAHYYNYFYVFSIVVGAVASVQVAVSTIGLMYALMAIPTMFSAFYLSPKVMKEAKIYFQKINRIKN
ncbi:MAG: alanine:cation symporter family protein [Cytophagales bacterium]|nr:MAG: alanine:cation symporter family protein [Cytophagales bacterium]